MLSLNKPVCALSGLHILQRCCAEALLLSTDQIRMSLDFMEAVKGAQKDISYEAPVRCKTCSKCM